MGRLNIINEKNNSHGHFCKSVLLCVTMNDSFSGIPGYICHTISPCRALLFSALYTIPCVPMLLTYNMYYVKRMPNIAIQYDILTGGIYTQ
jgi:hypothetical protein